MGVEGSNPFSRSSIDTILGRRLSLKRCICVMADRAIPARCHLREMPAMSTGESESEVSAAVAEAPDQPERTKPSPRESSNWKSRSPMPAHARSISKITIPRSEIDLQYEESLESLQKEAVVPGFRPGRAPRQLVVKRFRKQVSQQVKSNLLMSSLDQIDKEYKLEPIVQPRLDIDAIEIPENGPMSFEMDVEVRPQFDLPNYKGLKVKRPIAELSEKDVDDAIEPIPGRARDDRSQARG